MYVVKSGALIVASRLVSQDTVLDAPWEIISRANYLAHLAAIRPDVPTEVTRAQFFIALYRRDATLTRGNIRLFVEELAGEEGLIWFDEALTVERGNPLVNLLGLHLGYSPEDLDDLFRAASRITASD
jgi:hypothetical protein